MTRDDITRMAREAGMERVVEVCTNGTQTVEVFFPELLERFAALVEEVCLERNNLTWVANCKHLVKAEREACVLIVENEAAQYVEPTWAFEIVNDIRARGTNGQ